MRRWCGKKNGAVSFSRRADNHTGFGWRQKKKRFSVFFFTSPHEKAKRELVRQRRSHESFCHCGCSISVIFPPVSAVLCIRMNKKEGKYYTHSATLWHVTRAAVILSSAARIWIQGSEHNLPPYHSGTKSAPTPTPPAPLPPKPKGAYCNLVGCSPPR